VSSARNHPHIALDSYDNDGYNAATISTEPHLCQVVGSLVRPRWAGPPTLGKESRESGHGAALLIYVSELT
jgi:hypothetical protein